MHSTLTRWGLTAVVFPALVLLVGCGGEASTKGPSEQASPHAGELELAPDVKATIGLSVEEVRPRAFRFSVVAAGKVRANQDKVAFVGPIIQGKISRVFANWGDWVKQGQVLAYLESVEVGQAKAAYFKARAELEVAKANLRRKKRLFEEQIIPEKDLLAAEAQFTSAQTEADAAEKALHVIGFTEEEVASLSESHDLTAVMPIVAPIAGTVVDRQAVLGAQAEPSSNLFKIVDLSTLWVDADVYEKDLDKVRPGQRVEISVIAYPDETFSGRVSYLGDTLDEETRTTVVRTVVQNRENKLKPGMFATVRIITTAKAAAMILPEGAVVQEGGKSMVVVEEANHYRLREVQVGLTSDGMTEVVSGLNYGDRVVTAGHRQIVAQLMGSNRSD